MGQILLGDIQEYMIIIPVSYLPQIQVLTP